MAHITDRFYNSKWGVFTHYLPYIQNNPNHPANQKKGCTSWDACAEDLNVELLAAQLHEMGAGYLMFTLMQGDGYLAAPNAAYNVIAQSATERPCKRDIPGALIKALGKYDIDLYLYFTGDGPYKNPEVGSKFGFTGHHEMVTRDFVEKWSSVLEEYAVRYGDGVKGWWIDGCYKRLGNTDELLQLYVDAVKKGNPNAIVSFNNGTPTALERCFACDDYVAGEREDFDMIPTGRFVDGAQSYILAPLGVLPGGYPYEMWARPGLKHEGWWMRDYVKLVNTNGGVVSIDIMLNRDGSFEQEQMDALMCISR